MSKPPPILSALLWHSVVWHPSKGQTDYEELSELWKKFRDDLRWSEGWKPLPDAEALQGKDGYEVLARCQEPNKTFDYDYAFIYLNHDVIGVVAVLQSRIDDDFDALKQCLKDLPNLPTALGALWQFETLIKFTAQTPTVLDALKKDLYEANGFEIKEGFTLWNLALSERGMSRLLISVPLRERDRDATMRLADADDYALSRFALTPAKWTCPQLLDYQTQAAKVRYLTNEYHKHFGLHEVGNIRSGRETVNAEIEDIWKSDQMTPHTLRLKQEDASDLLLEKCDLQGQLIALSIATDNLKRLQPRPANDSTAEFNGYQRLQTHAQGLRGAIETELSYTELTIERIGALQTVYSNRIENEKSYRNLVQTSFISGVGVGLSVISATTEYDYPELRWPLVAFSTALGFALPILTLHRHEETKDGAYPWAIIALGGTGFALACSYVREIVTHRITAPPLWGIVFVGLIGCFVTPSIYKLLVKNAAKTQPLRTFIGAVINNMLIKPITTSSLPTTTPPPSITAVECPTHSPRETAQQP